MPRWSQPRRRSRTSRATSTGDNAEVHGILTPNADPHDYEPRPSDATAIAGAELVFTSGGEVDEWVDELIESSGTDAKVVTLLDSAPIVRTQGGDEDPHWWQDPRNAIAATETIRDELSETDPADAAALCRERRRLHRRNSALRPHDRRLHGLPAGQSPQARDLARLARLLRRSLRHRGRGRCGAGSVHAGAAIERRDGRPRRADPGRAKSEQYSPRRASPVISRRRSQTRRK